MKQTFGTWGPIGHKLITDIGRTIAGITKNPKSTSFIFQAISMAVQRGNVQCVQGAYGESAFEELDEIFYILQPKSVFQYQFDILNMNKNHLFKKNKNERLIYELKILALPKSIQGYYNLI